jgi:hypothetical protein
MPKKVSTALIKQRAAHRRQRGAGFFSNIAKSIMKIARIVKDKKLISKGLNLAGDLTGHQGVKRAGQIASTVGLGKRRKGAMKKKKGKGLKLAGAGRSVGKGHMCTKKMGMGYGQSTKLAGRLKMKHMFP